MHGPLNQAPTVVTMTLRALARFPERRAFVWDGGSLSYLDGTKGATFVLELPNAGGREIPYGAAMPSLGRRATA